MNRNLLTLLLILIALQAAAAGRFISFSPCADTDFSLTQTSDTVRFDPQDWEGVKMAVGSLRNDLQAVTGSPCTPVLVGTVGKSSIAREYPEIARMLKGKWEQFIITPVTDSKNDRKALLILGSDKRGTIYGIYELSRQIGVSPWYWMADAPVSRHDSIYVSKGMFTDDEPKVKYRGIFINDEWPSFGTWCENRFGGINSNAYSREYSIPAHRFSRKKAGSGAEWIFLPDLGRGEGCMGSSNVMAEQSGASLEYDVVTDGDTATFAIGILPTQDILPERGLRLGIQVDSLPMQVVDARRGLVDTFNEYTPENLSVSKVLKPLPPRSRLSLSGFVGGTTLPRRKEVFDNIRWLEASFSVPAGRHTLRLVMIDPETIVEQIVVNPDNNSYSYFGNGFFAEK